MPALVWLVLAVALAVGEAFTLDLVLIMLAGAALAGGAAALATDSLALQAVTAAVAAVLLLGAVRPVARRHLTAPSLPSGRARLTGRPAVVVVAVTADSGQVRVDGELWRARPYADGLPAQVGARVVIASVEGATLHVYPEELA